MGSRGELAVVARPGLSTVQDAGRPGWAAIGVSHSGAWHQSRYRLCTELVGEPGAPAVELLAGEVVLHLRQSTVIAALGPAELHVDDAAVSVGLSLVVQAQTEVRMRHSGAGPAYLVLAGWQAPRVLGSASFDTFARIGGAPLRAGDVLAGQGAVDDAAGRFVRRIPEMTGPLRVIPTDDDAWLSHPWGVHATTRSGTRLRGPVIAASGTLPSAPVVPGAIQMTPAGEGIILGPDSGVTGGYPVLGCVITADRDRISDLSPGAPLTFAAVTVDEAVAVYEARERELARAVVDSREIN